MATKHQRKLLVYRYMVLRKMIKHTSFYYIVLEAWLKEGLRQIWSIFTPSPYCIICLSPDTFCSVVLIKPQYPLTAYSSILYYSSHLPPLPLHVSSAFSVKPLSSVSSTSPVLLLSTSSAPFSVLSLTLVYSATLYCSFHLLPAPLCTAQWGPPLAFTTALWILYCFSCLPPPSPKSL